MINILVETKAIQMHLKIENLLKFKEPVQEWIALLSLWNQAIE